MLCVITIMLALTYHVDDNISNEKCAQDNRVRVWNYATKQCEVQWVNIYKQRHTKQTNNNNNNESIIKQILLLLLLLTIMIMIMVIIIMIIMIMILIKMMIIVMKRTKLRGTVGARQGRPAGGQQ